MERDSHCDLSLPFTLDVVNPFPVEVELWNASLPIFMIDRDGVGCKKDLMGHLHCDLYPNEHLHLGYVLYPDYEQYHKYCAKREDLAEHQYQQRQALKHQQEADMNATKARHERERRNQRDSCENSTK